MTDQLGPPPLAGLSLDMAIHLRGVSRDIKGAPLGDRRKAPSA
jgi:hypothetical protein